MPRGIPGSGPTAGRKNKVAGKGRGRKSSGTTLATIAARSGQQASNGADQNGGAAPATATGKGRGNKGRATAGAIATATTKTTTKRGQSASNGQQRGDQPSKAPDQNEINGVKIETLVMPGRTGRPQQAEEFPFGSLDVSTEDKDAGTMVGPSFLIPEDKNPDQVLAAARKRHKGKTFMSRKWDGGVRIWRKT